MQNKKNKNGELRILIKMVLMGEKSVNIARKLNYHEATINYKLLKVFKKFGAKNRYEFVILFFAKIINELKEEIKQKNSQIKKQKKLLKMSSIA